MTVYAVRLENLNIMVSAFGSARALADHTGVDENHLRQILRGGTLPSGKKKNVGNDLARRLEKGCCLDKGWMDNAHDDQPPAKDSITLAPDEQMILGLYRRASTKLRRLIRDAAELAREEEE